MKIVHNNQQSVLGINRKRVLFSYVLISALLLIATVLVQYVFLAPSSKATVQGQSSQVRVEQTSYRLYEPSTTSAPGLPLATDNTAATLAQTKNSFRVRLGMRNTTFAFKQIATTGWNHTCGVNLSGDAYCWGEGAWGVLGTGSTNNATTPTRINMAGVLAGKTVNQVAVGDWHTCAIASDDRAYCWGYGVNTAELGNGSLAQANSPVAVTSSGVLAGKTLTQITAGFNHNCVIDSNGYAYCWGEGSYGALGNGSTALARVPVAVNMTGALAGRTIKQISGGYRHTCAVTLDGRAYCWGENSSGQLGNNSTTQANVPVAVTMTGALAGKTIQYISAGSRYHVCAIASDNGIYCWGSNESGQLGNGTTTASRVPVAVTMTGALAGKTVVDVSVGDGYTCVSTSDGRAYCWGKNDVGQLGNGTTTASRVPVAVTMTGALAGRSVIQVSNGVNRTCALANDGKSYCWGENAQGEFGNGGTANSSVPAVTRTSGDFIPAGSMRLRAQYAEKTASSCSATSGWQDITDNSALAYSVGGPAHATAITANTTDPALSNYSSRYSYQSIIKETNATNSAIIFAGETGLWDLALTDMSLKRNTDYCIRLATDTTAAPGTSIDAYSQYPEFRTADGSLDIRFADGSDNTLANPTTDFTSTNTISSVGTTSASLSNNSSQQLEVSNTLSSTGWSVALAVTGGTNARWTRAGGGADYAFNAADSAQGRLTVDLSSATFAASGSTPAGQACTASGLSFGVSGAFISGTSTANAITLANASNSSGLNCIFKLQNINLSQTIPRFQAPGTYTLPVTATVTVQ